MEKRFSGDGRHQTGLFLIGFELRLSRKTVFFRIRKKNAVCMLFSGGDGRSLEEIVSLTFQLDR